MNVSISYSFNPLCDDNRIPGNAGLMDQALALQWVRNNIEAFGGDPERVTLWGYMGGAAHANFLMNVKEVNETFQQAILTGGVAANPGTSQTKEESAQAARRLATYLGCDGEGGAGEKAGFFKNWKDCLKGKNQSEVAKAAAVLKEKHGMHFMPTSGLKSFPLVVGDVGSSKPVLLGTTNHQGFSDVLSMREFDEVKSVDQELKVTSRCFIPCILT